MLLQLFARMPLRYEDYASRVSMRERLHQVLDSMNHGLDLHLNKIAEYLEQPHTLTPHLGLQYLVFSNIQQRYQSDPNQQR